MRMTVSTAVLSKPWFLQPKKAVFIYFHKSWGWFFVESSLQSTSLKIVTKKQTNKLSTCRGSWAGRWPPVTSVPYGLGLHSQSSEFGFHFVYIQIAHDSVFNLKK